MVERKFKQVDVDTEATKKYTTENMLYADRIINFQIGFNVTKLTLGVETGPKVLNPVQTLVLPTNDLLKAIEFILDQFENNETLKAALSEDGQELLTRLNSKK